MKVAIVHYWLVGMRGGEKVIESLIDLYPNADIYTHVYIPSKISNKIRKQKIFTTFINKLPFSKKYYKHYLLLMPLALKLLNLKEYDLIISSESGPTKGIVKSRKSVHICYCHSPMRYIWDMKDDYLNNFNFIERVIAKIVFPIIKKWDISTAKQVDKIIVNSNFVNLRVKKFWNRESDIVHPPVNIDDFYISNEIKDYYLILSQLVQYKRVDIAIDAFNKSNKKLIVIGEGDELEVLKNKANKNIQFIGWKNDNKKKKILSNCKALIFPGIEDFGIVPIESMASGRPVIAFKEGGALDYIEDNINGVFFHSQNSDSLNKAITYFENNINFFHSNKIKESVFKFKDSLFKKKIKEIIDRSLLDNE